MNEWIRASSPCSRDDDAWDSSTLIFIFIVDARRTPRHRLARLLRVGVSGSGSSFAVAAAGTTTLGCAAFSRSSSSLNFLKTFDLPLVAALASPTAKMASTMKRTGFLLVHVPQDVHGKHRGGTLVVVRRLALLRRLAQAGQDADQVVQLVQQAVLAGRAVLQDLLALVHLPDHLLKRLAHRRGGHGDDQRGTRRVGEPRACGRGACGRAWGCDDGGNRAFSERFPGRSVDMRSDDNAHRGTRGNVRPRFPCVSIGRVARAGGHCVERHRAIPLVSPLARLPNMYTYAYSPATGIEADRAAFDAAPRDENRHPADVLTLDQLHAEKRGDARRAFADVGNLSRLVSADRARKSRRPSSRCSDRSEVASARSRATAATDASTALVGEWDAPRARASADAVDARPHRRRDHRHAATDADSPRTPTVESPADVDRTVSDATDDTIPPARSPSSAPITVDGSTTPTTISRWRRNTRDRWACAAAP